MFTKYVVAIVLSLYSYEEKQWPSGHKMWWILYAPQINVSLAPGTVFPLR